MPFALTKMREIFYDKMVGNWRGFILLGNIQILVSQIVVMFLLMAVGYVCFRLKYLNNDGAGQLSLILTRVVAPSVIIDSFQREFDPALGTELVVSVGCAFLAMGLSIVVSHILFRADGPHKNYADKRMCVVFTNCGFMALPLLDALYGSHGLFLGSAFIAVNNVLLWSYGITQLSHETSRSQKIRNAVLNPGTVSVAIGLLFFLTPLELLAVPATCVSYLASLNTPVAMIILGAFLAQCDLRSCFRDKQVYFVTALRLLVLPLITMVIFLLLPLDSTLRNTMLISAAAPVAMVCSMFGQVYGTDYLFSTRAVAVSTILSAITIPGMIALCGLLGG